MEYVLLTTAWLVASVLFILSLRGLSSQETARKGNLYGIIGMAIAVGSTALASVIDVYIPLVLALGAGAAIGAVMAARVAMTAMPELVALLHSFVGLAAVLVGYSSYLAPAGHGAGSAIFRTEVFIDVAIGAITFTGSVIAFLKLRGNLSGRPLLLPGRHLLNLGVLITMITLGVLFGRADGTEGLIWLL
ncbi:MAG: NAD(P)(+) transhydrogenase (Re/Si-specific) subunit beta, partial [bacterium]